jgi:hypothetical protein
MESRLSIENVTNGLLTLQKLKQLYKPAARLEDGSGEDSSYIRPDKLHLLQETIMAIKSFVPETRGSSLSEAFQQGSRYSGAYREMKQHVRDMGRKNIDSTQLLKGLKLVVPVLNSRQRLYMDKIVKIFDILQS